MVPWPEKVEVPQILEGVDIVFDIKEALESHYNEETQAWIMLLAACQMYREALNKLDPLWQQRGYVLVSNSILEDASERWPQSMPAWWKKQQ